MVPVQEAWQDMLMAHHLCFALLVQSCAVCESLGLPECLIQ